MKAKMEKPPVINPNAAVSVARDGTVLYSNESGELLLREWGVGIGGKIPSTIEDLVQQVISLNSPEKIEVKVGKRVYLVVFHPLPEQECVNISGFDISDHEELEKKCEQIESFEHKKTENELQLMNEILESSDDAIITHSLNGIITSWNKAAERIYGYSAEDILGKPIFILELPVLFEETKELTELIKQEERIHHYETLQLRKDGQIINVSLTISPIFDDSGYPKAVLIISRDTTRIKKTEEKLRKTEEIYKIVTEQTGQMIYHYDLKNDKCEWSGAIEEVTGYKFDEIQCLGTYFWITNIEPLNTIRTITKFQDMIVTGDRYREELKLKRKDGTYIYVENQGVYLRDHKNIPHTAIGVIKDITDLKNATEKFIESEEKYRSFVHNFQGIVYRRNVDFMPVFLHGTIKEITGYSEKDFESRIKWKDIIHPDDLLLVLKEEEKVQNLPFTGHGDIEYRIKNSDGRIRWVHEVYQKIKKEDEKKDFYQGTIYDVTERRETEEFLENIETARRKEIHHRIKNNLQVISSLLDLQAEKFQDKESINDSEVLAAFRESQDRVASMALIHEELYNGKGLDTLDFSAYLRKLVENLFQTYSLNSENIRLYMNLEENAFFDIDIAVPLGIIVNELISNSLKYAFSTDREGEIRVQLCREENNNKTHRSLFSLTISDNGKGIPEDLELGSLKSLGLQLVNVLTDQLDGEIELKRDHGTKFRITFEVTERK